MCDELLCGPDTRCTALIDSSALNTWVNGQRDQKRFSVYQVWTMLMLELWCRSHASTGRKMPTVHTARLTVPRLQAKGVL
jgi:hypothetical protein